LPCWLGRYGCREEFQDYSSWQVSRWPYCFDERNKGSSFELERLISCKIRTYEDCWAEELPHSWWVTNRLIDNYSTVQVM
jgi:hypothetical protein